MADEKYAVMVCGPKKRLAHQDAAARGQQADQRPRATLSAIGGSPVASRNTVVRPGKQRSRHIRVAAPEAERVVEERL